MDGLVETSRPRRFAVRVRATRARSGEASLPCRVRARLDDPWRDADPGTGPGRVANWTCALVGGAQPAFSDGASCRWTRTFGDHDRTRCCIRQLGGRAAGEEDFWLSAG